MNEKQSQDYIGMIECATFSKEPVPRDLVLSWMSSTSLEQLGAVWRLLVMVKIEPPLAPNEVRHFELAYLELCIVQDPPGPYAHSRKTAIGRILTWFSTEDVECSETARWQHRVRDSIAELYRRGDDEVRRAIVSILLPHLLGYRVWCGLFSPWLDDALLGDAYRQGADLGLELVDEVALERALAAMCGSGKIPRAQLLRWLSNSSLEVVGVAESILTDNTYCSRVSPPVTQTQAVRALECYYERCLKEDPIGRWVLGRYGAAWAVVNWFSAVPQSETLESQAPMLRWKQWLARIYIAGDDNVRDAIIAGALEHIMEEPRWQVFFGEWRDDPILKDAFNGAMEWVRGHER